MTRNSLISVNRIKIIEINHMMGNKNIALITGVTGQDGSYLSEFLLTKGYEVHGIIRRSSVDFRERIAHLEGMPNFHLHYADMGDSMSLVKLLGKVQPTEIYNLAAQSHVQVSFDAPESTADVDAVGVLVFLKQSALTIWRRLVRSIRHLLPNFTVRWRKSLRTKIPPFIHTVHTQWLSSTVIGSSRSTVKHTICSAVQVSSSITNRSVVARLS